MLLLLPLCRVLVTSLLSSVTYGRETCLLVAESERCLAQSNGEGNCPSNNTIAVVFRTLQSLLAFGCTTRRHNDDRNLFCRL